LDLLFIDGDHEFEGAPAGLGIAWSHGLSRSGATVVCTTSDGDRSFSVSSRKSIGDAASNIGLPNLYWGTLSRKQHSRSATLDAGSAND